MNVKELRIGNYILDDDGSWSYINGFSPLEHLTRCDTDEGCSILIDIIGTDGAISRNWAAESSDCKPIHITAEWLERLGFKEYHSTDVVRRFESTVFDDMVFHLSATNYVVVTHLFVRCEYVHQLQNICFVLKGEELTLKTESK